MNNVLADWVKAKLNLENLSIFIEKTIVLFSTLFVILLLVLSWKATAVFVRPHSEALVLITTNPATPNSWVTGLGIMLVLLLACAIVGVVSQYIPPLLLLVVAIATTTYLSFSWIESQQAAYCLFADSRNLIAYATGIILDNPSYLQAHTTVFGYPLEDMQSYFRHYPYQAGSFLYILTIFKAFGVGNIMAIQYTNVIANETVLVCLYLICRRIFPSARPLKYTLVLAASFMPFWISCLLPYGNCVGLAFGSIFFVIQVEAMCCSSRLKAVIISSLSAIPLAVALTVKATLILFALATFIGWLIIGIRDKKLAEPSAALLILIIANAISGYPHLALEITLQEDFGSGMPKTSWIAMGLNERSLNNATPQPGWWDKEAYEIFDKANGEVAVQNKLASESISNSIEEFKNSPAYAKWFFKTKLASEWAEPTFQSIYYAILNRDSNITIPSYADSYYKSLNKFFYSKELDEFTRFYGAFQRFMYLFAAFGMARLFFSRVGMRSTPKEQMAHRIAILLCVLFFTGFGCYLLWEAKSIYTLPFFFYLIPIATIGIDSTVRVLSKASVSIGKLKPVAHLAGKREGL